MIASPGRPVIRFTTIFPGSSGERTRTTCVVFSGAVRQLRVCFTDKQMESCTRRTYQITVVQVTQIILTGLHYLSMGLIFRGTRTARMAFSGTVRQLRVCSDDRGRDPHVGHIRSLTHHTNHFWRICIICILQGSTGLKHRICFASVALANRQREGATRQTDEITAVQSTPIIAMDLHHRYIQGSTGLIYERIWFASAASVYRHTDEGFDTSDRSDHCRTGYPYTFHGSASSSVYTRCNEVDRKDLVRQRHVCLLTRKINTTTIILVQVRASTSGCCLSSCLFYTATVTTFHASDR